MKKFINKKEDNVIYVKKEVWETEKNVSLSREGSTGHVVHLPVNERDQKAYTPSAKDLLVNYGAVAGLLMVVSGVFYYNADQINTDEGRGLATHEIEINRQFQNKLVEDLNAQRRDLAAIDETQPEIELEILSLEKREDFEYGVLDSYHVDFNSNGWVQEIQLKAQKEPVFISNVSQWIQKHQLFFPKDLSYLGESSENLHQFFVFRSNRIFYHFELNEDHQLISLIIEDE